MLAGLLDISLAIRHPKASRFELAGVEQEFDQMSWLFQGSFVFITSTELCRKSSD
jgi:hypothetical protein